MKSEKQIVCCDCLEGMSRLPDKCIPLTLTSPPYDNLRTYDGHNNWNFMAVATELYRITMQGGVVVWVVQEQIVDGSESGETSRQRLAFANIGFRLHHTMVMGPLGGCQHSSNRYGRPLEYAFILSRGAPRYFCPLRDKPNKEAGRVKLWKTATQMAASTGENTGRHHRSAFGRRSGSTRSGGTTAPRKTTPSTTRRSCPNRWPRITFCPGARSAISFSTRSPVLARPSRWRR